MSVRCSSPMGSWACKPLPPSNACSKAVQPAAAQFVASSQCSCMASALLAPLHCWPRPSPCCGFPACDAGRHAGDTQP
jgi:hypothetical protein